MNHITAKELFVHQSHTIILPDKFFDFLFVSTASVVQLVDLTHSVITAGVFSAQETLRVWELRLMLLLFAGQLPVAKQEASALNKSIYLHENPDHAKYGQNPESGVAKPHFVNPLPRNNEGTVPYTLLLLLLRLKSSPSMATVNEIYRVCYQLRLRGQALQRSTLLNQLMRLAYSVIVQLVIMKNSATLVSYLESLAASLEQQLKVEWTETAARNKGSIQLALLFAHVLVILRHTKDLVVQDAQFEALRPVFETLSPQALESLQFALNSWALHVGGPAPEQKVALSDLDFKSVVGMIRNGRISTRIICCTVAIWDLDAAFDVHLGGGHLSVSVPKGDHYLDEVYAHVVSQWGNNSNRVFCFE